MNEILNVETVKLILAGAAGAFVRAVVVHRGSILLWRRWSKKMPDGTVIKGVDLGIIASLIVGAATGVLVDQNPMVAFSWSITFSHLVEEIAKSKLTSGGLPVFGDKLGNQDDDSSRRC